MDTNNVKKDVLRVILSFFSNILDKTSTTGGKWAVRNIQVSAIGTVLTGNIETPGMAVYSVGTTITAGKKSVTIITDSSFTGTVLGAVAAADMVYTYTASAGNTLGTIVITVSAGSFTVLTTE